MSKDGSSSSTSTNDKENNNNSGSNSKGGSSEMSLRAQKNLLPKLITPAFVRQFLGEKESAVLELWQKMTMELERGRHLRAHGGESGSRYQIANYM